MSGGNASSRSLLLADQTVSLRIGHRSTWHVSLSEIRVIGEYTTDAGPIQDDWFVVFVRADGDWFEAPADIPNIEAILAQLSTQLDWPIRFGLANSTAFASRVLWPSTLVDHPLFAFTSRTSGNWLLRAAGVQNVRYELTTEVADALAIR